MPKLGRSPFDDPAYVVSDLVPSNPGTNLGSADKPYAKVFAEAEAVSGDFDVTGTVTAAGFNLTDGTLLNHVVNGATTGLSTALTGSSANVGGTFTLDKADSYVIRVRCVFKFNGATFAANQTLSLKLRRTNNTAADLSGSNTTLTLPIITTITDGFEVTIPEVVYSTAGRVNDTIGVFAILSATPSAGSVTLSEVSYTAVRVGG